jgi:uroporphyrin-III C-methyltransferase/precorrin-2 dehydrogenase/sirohydrochlorin ferrochelatase
VFARVTRPDAQGAIGTLRDLPELVRQTNGGPAILIIGDVVRHAGSLRRETPKQIISDLLDAAE